MNRHLKHEMLNYDPDLKELKPTIIYLPGIGAILLRRRLHTFSCQEVTDISKSCEYK